MKENALQADLVGRAERLRDWFDLQLLFAETLTAEQGVSAFESITHYTNLHRRFGFGRPSDGADSPDWIQFVKGLESLPTRPERVEHTVVFAAERLGQQNQQSSLPFGCFNFDPPGEDGVLKLHFAPNDTSGGTGPLSREKVAARKQELLSMFEHVRAHYPERARSVRGASWLYNLEAYRRLFPVSYIDACEVYKSENMTLQGMPFWGQFLDHEESIRPVLRDQFLVNLKALDMRCLWKLFPLPLVVTRAPIQVFYSFYGL